MNRELLPIMIIFLVVSVLSFVMIASLYEDVTAPPDKLRCWYGAMHEVNGVKTTEHCVFGNGTVVK